MSCFYFRWTFVVSFHVHLSLMSIHNKWISMFTENFNSLNISSITCVTIWIFSVLTGIFANNMINSEVIEEQKFKWLKIKFKFSFMTFHWFVKFNQTFKWNSPCFINSIHCKSRKLEKPLNYIRLSWIEVYLAWNLFEE